MRAAPQYRACTFCGSPLERRSGEQHKLFAKRTYCDELCETSSRTSDWSADYAERLVVNGLGLTRNEAACLGVATYDRHGRQRYRKPDAVVYVGATLNSVDEILTCWEVCGGPSLAELPESSCDCGVSCEHVDRVGVWVRGREPTLGIRQIRP